MRVLQLGPYPPPHGGIQTHIVALREHLRGQGHACGVINLTRHRGRDADEVWYPRSPAAVLWLLGRLPYDLLHLHLGGTLTRRLLWLALMCAWMPGKRAVLSLHSGGLPSSPAGRATHRGTFRAFVMRRFDAVIAINGEIAGWFRACGVAADRLRVISPHALRRPAPVLPDDLRLFGAAHRPLLISVGLLESEYDLVRQIDVLGQVRHRHPEAGLLLIGSGSLADTLRRSIAARPYAEHVLLAGDVPHPVTLAALAAADVYLRTTHYDGDSISVREALTLGIPVVATDNGMRPPGCHLIPPHDTEALFTAILESFGKPRSAPLNEPELAGPLREIVALYSRIQPWHVGRTSSLVRDRG